MLKSVRISIRERMMQLGRRLVTQSGRWAVTKTVEPNSLIELLGRLHPVLPEQDLRRIGPAGDGGYLLPDDLNGIAACFSPGVGDLSGFELDCVELGMRAHLADASVASPQFADERLDFIPKFIRAISDAESITLDEWVATAEPNEAEDLLLQIDIEGDEWGVFLGASPAVLRRFRVIVAEFHNLQGLQFADSFSLQALVFEKLLESHTCVHIHPNNACGVSTVAGISLPRVAEFTFLRNDRIDRSLAKFATQFPHALDEDNIGPWPTVTLPSSMYRSN
jgi:FkbM family methyltransferase